MNTCILHSSGALLMDISSISLLEGSLAGRPASTPMTEHGEYERHPVTNCILFMVPLQIYSK